MKLATPTLRRAKDVLVTTQIAGRVTTIIVRFRPIAPKPTLPHVTGGWWTELLDGRGDPILGAVRLVAGVDLWAAHTATLRAQLGTHLYLACTATPDGDRGLAAQCEVSLVAAG